jgi:hypothetical protein
MVYHGNRKNGYHGKLTFRKYHGRYLPVTAKKKFYHGNSTMVRPKKKKYHGRVTTVGAKSKKLPVSTPKEDI